MTGYGVRSGRETEGDNQRSIEARRAGNQLLLDPQAEVTPPGPKAGSIVDILVIIGHTETEFRARSESQADERFWNVEALLSVAASFGETIFEDQDAIRHDGTCIRDGRAISCDRG